MSDDDPINIPDDDGSVDAVVAHVARLAEEAEELTNAATESGTSTDLVATGTNLPADQIKTRMASARSALIHKQTELDRAQTELQQRLNAQIAKAESVIAPMRKMVARLEEGIHAVNLYVGSHEDIVTLASGEPCSADTPVHLRQMVLAMDEETAIAAEKGGIDATNIGSFDDWLLADPAHLHQVLPEERGVVVLTPRRTNKDYGDPWITSQMGEANAESYWLIRNGENLYRMTTSLRVGRTLIPPKDELDKLFYEDRYVGGLGTFEEGRYERVPIEPGSHSWFRAEERADTVNRHRMKIALILQGLIDRTAVLAPLPAADVSVLRPESYDAGHVVVVTDAEAAIGTGREPFRDWLSRLNAQLRPGMRVICAFNGEHWRNVNSTDSWSRHSRVWPETASAPESNTILTIEDRKPDGGLVVRYERTDKRHGYEHGDWGDWGAWDYEMRASVLLYPSDRFVLPFDLVTVAEMQAYLDARTERHHYAQMFPVLQAAIAAKHDETAAEAPFRVLLAGEIAKANDVAVADAEEAVPDLVDWWKLANRHHRPLVDPDPKTQAKAVRMIVAEDAARRRAADDADPDGEQDMVARIRSEHPDVLVVARKRNGYWTAFVPADDENVFVHVLEWTKTGKSRPTVEWMLPGSRLKSVRVLWSSDRWGEWDHRATLGLYLTGPELAETVDQAVEVARGWASAGDDRGEPVAVLYDAKDREFDVYFNNFEDEEDSWHGSGARVTSAHFPWKRSKGSTVKVTGPGWATYTAHWRTDEEWPWSNAVQPAVVGGFSVRSSRKNQGPSLVWLNEALLPEMKEQHDRYVERRNSERALEGQAGGFLTGILEAFTERRWDQAYKTFLDDYKDPTLWEAHRKTIQISPVDHVVREEIKSALVSLIKSGDQVEGRTVGEVLDSVPGARKRVSVPKGMLAMTFKAPSGDDE